jgi:signal transduction histidine kinase
MRLLPRSLFSRLVLLLLVVLVTAQMLGLAIHLHERSELLREASGMQAARRIADIVRLLDSLPAAERTRIVGILDTPTMRVRLDRPQPLPAGQSAEQGARAMLFGALLRRSLGEDRQVEVAMTDVRPYPPGGGAGMGSPMTGYPSAGAGGQMPPGHMKKMAGGGPSFLVQTRLADGTPISFDTRPPAATAQWPLRMLLSVAVLLLSVLAVSLLAVRWVTRPLATLADAADELGRNIHRPPLAETGPVEVVRAARAFNSMQARLADYLRDRTRFLAAMSHDLKTPITRLRLRAELLDDPAQRAKFTADLTEMESMVATTLEFMRGADTDEKAVAMDIAALLASIQADLREAGGAVTLEAGALQPYVGRPQALKRCLVNLMQNAIDYGGGADVIAADRPDALEIRVRDRGPGIPDADLERVFEPYFRLEGSRNRDTGGTGLGLAIARNIARIHGGDIVLHNRPEGGLEAVLQLPRAA